MVKTDKRTILLYFTVTFAVAWALQALALTLKNAYVSQLTVALCMFAPMLGVLAGNKGLKFEKTGISWKLNIRKNWKWFLLAWLGLIVWNLVCIVFYFIIFPDQFDINCGFLIKSIPTGKPAEFSGFALGALVLFSAGLYGPFLNMFLAIGEEAGWRGYMTPMLSNFFGARGALILSGVIWAVWHWPLILFSRYEYGTGYPGAPVTGALAMILFTTSVGILFSFLYEKSKCIWVSALGHGTLNAVAAGGLFFTSGESQNYLLGPTIAGVVAIIPTLIIAVIILLQWNKIKNTQE